MTMHPDLTMPNAERKVMSLPQTHSKPLPPTPTPNRARSASPSDTSPSPSQSRSPFLSRLIGLKKSSPRLPRDPTKPEYFVATMTRSEAEYLLTEFGGRHIDGAFLFRKSRETVILSLCADGGFHHYTLKLKKPRGKSKRSELWLDKQLQRFVKHHRKKRSKGQFAHTLTSYVTYENATLSHEASEEQASPKLRKRMLSMMPATVYTSTMPRSPTVGSAERVDRDFGAAVSPDLSCDAAPERDQDPDYDEAKNLTRSRPVSCESTTEQFVELTDALRRKQTHVYDDTGGLDPNASISCPPTVWQNSMAPVPADSKKLRISRSFDALETTLEDTLEGAPEAAPEAGRVAGHLRTDSSEGPVQFSIMPGTSGLASVLSAMHFEESSGPSSKWSTGDATTTDDDDDLSSGDDQNLAWLAAVEEVIDEDDDFESFELADAPRFKLSMHRGLAKVAAGRAFSSATT